MLYGRGEAGCRGRPEGFIVQGLFEIVKVVEGQQLRVGAQAFEALSCSRASSRLQCPGLAVVRYTVTLDIAVTTCSLASFQMRFPTFEFHF